MPAFAGMMQGRALGCSCSTSSRPSIRAQLQQLQHQRRRRAVAAASASASSSSASSSQGTTTTTATAPPTLARDATADLLQALMAAALKRRLTAYESVEAHCDATAAGVVLEGRFDALRVAGAGWVTPLGMRAHALDVRLSAMQVDYAALVLERRVRLTGPVPRGRVAIQLSGADMGSFVSHPLFLQAAEKAGLGFRWDRDSVVIARDRVLFSGVEERAGARFPFECVMLPDGAGPGRLTVGARRVVDPPAPAAAAAAAAGAGPAAAAGPAAGPSAAAGEAAAAAPAPPPGGDGAQELAARIAAFFGRLSLDLSGIEVGRPRLSLPAGAVSHRGEGPLLLIELDVAMRALPPINMQF